MKKLPGLAALIAMGLAAAGGTANAAVFTTTQNTYAQTSSSAQVPNGAGVASQSSSESLSDATPDADPDFDSAVSSSVTRSGLNASSTGTASLSLQNDLSGSGVLTASGSAFASASTGCGTLGCGFAEGQGYSYMFLNFTLDSPYHYEADFALSQTGPSSAQTASATFTGDTLGLLLSGDSLGNPVVSSSGTLLAGFYTLWATAYDDAYADGTSDGPGSAAFAVNLKLTPVPLPAAAWLLLSGLAGLLPIGRRPLWRRRASTREVQCASVA